MQLPCTHWDTSGRTTRFFNFILFLAITKNLIQIQSLNSFPCELKQVLHYWIYTRAISTLQCNRTRLNYCTNRRKQGGPMAASGGKMSAWLALLPLCSTFSVCSRLPKGWGGVNLAHTQLLNKSTIDLIGDIFIIIYCQKAVKEKANLQIFKSSNLGEQVFKCKS